MIEYPRHQKLTALVEPLQVEQINQPELIARTKPIASGKQPNLVHKVRLRYLKLARVKLLSVVKM